MSTNLSNTPKRDFTEQPLTGTEQKVAAATAEGIGRTGEFDFDRLRSLAESASKRIFENVSLRNMGMPMLDNEPMAQYARAASPNAVQMLLYRLDTAMSLLTLMKDDASLPMRKRIEMFLSGEVTDHMLFAALPHLAVQSHWIDEAAGAVADAAGAAPAEADTTPSSTHPAGNA